MPDTPTPTSASTSVSSSASASTCNRHHQVKAAKAAAKGDGDSAFVSTNDLLTTAWAKATRAQLLEMPINLRNRLSGIGDADAGNYEWVVFYQEEDCLRPGQIRKSLSTPGKYVRCGRDPPRPLRSGMSLVRARYSVITNWATFARDLEMPGCEQRLHMPCMDLAMAACELAIVFRATRTEVGVGRRSESRGQCRSPTQACDLCARRWATDGPWPPMLVAIWSTGPTVPLRGGEGRGNSPDQPCWRMAWTQ